MIQIRSGTLYLCVLYYLNADVELHRLATFQSPIDHFKRNVIASLFVSLEPIRGHLFKRITLK